MPTVWFTLGQHAAVVAGARIDRVSRAIAVIPESRSSIPPAVVPVAGSSRLQPQIRRTAASLTRR